MVSSKKQPPLQDYVTKLLLLELVKCTAAKETDQMRWLSNVLSHLNKKWGEN